MLNSARRLSRFLCTHLLGEKLPSAMQAAHHGPDGNAEGPGSIEVRPLLEIDQGDHCTESGR
jgi:hypothetical protein